MSEQCPQDETYAPVNPSDEPIQILDDNAIEPSEQKIEDNPSQPVEDRIEDSPSEPSEEKAAQARIVPASPRATFVKKRNSRHVLAAQTRLKNSLLAGVGFFELANAGDFAANVWNESPLPIYAIVLMALGGTLALCASFFAVADVRLSRRNLRLLRAERHRLHEERIHRVEEGQTVLDVDTRLDVNFRELGTEILTRFCLDILLGVGAVLVGIGTLMAIGGRDPMVFKASNYLSGYLGNSPVAFYAVVNAAWCLYVFIVAHKHRAVVRQTLDGGEALAHVKRYTRNVQKFTAASGITGLLGGFGSLVVATRWWGYIVLIPVIISSICCNYFWRHNVGYDHPFVEDSLGMSEVSLVSEMEYIASMQRILSESSPLLENLGLDPQSLSSVLNFIISNDLFEKLCIRLLNDPVLSSTLLNTSTSEGTLVVDLQSLLLADDNQAPRILSIAEICITKDAPRQFRYQQRYLSETLGSCLRIMCITASAQTPKGA